MEIRNVISRRVLCPFVVAVFLSVPSPVRAQQAAGPWEFEFHGGGALVNNPTDGTAGLPVAVPPFTTVVGTASRKISSWYFGDGAALLNQVNAALGAASRITPLDPVLTSSLAERRPSASFGFRLSRALSPRFGAEFTFDYSLGRLEMSPAALAGIEASRASFTAAWSALIATSPFTKPTVTSVSTIQDREGRQTATTGALTINLKTTGTVIPYATIGAGLISHTGSTPSASLTGSYQFQTGFFPVSETDTVTVTSSIDDTMWVGVLGGGLKYLLSPRWGMRVDVRAHLGKGATATLVNTTPTVAILPAAGVSSGATASFTAPAVQFSNNTAFGSSSLNGARLSGFQSFSGSGMQNQVVISAGVFLRF